MKRLFFSIFALFAISSAGFAQEESKGKFDLSVDLSSGFVWRGLTNNTLPVVQPSFTFSSGNFFIGAWASTPIGFDWGQPHEVDIFLGFQLAPAFTLGLTDYFVYGSNWSESYFNWDKNETCHALDLQLIYDGSGSFPLKTMISTIIAGDDLKEVNKSNYSTYLELGYGRTTSNNIDWDVAFGIVPMKSDFYGTDEIRVVNLSLSLSKNFEITPTYSMPLSLKFTVNPNARSAFLTAAVTLF